MSDLIWDIRTFPEDEQLQVFATAVLPSIEASSHAKELGRLLKINPWFLNITSSLPDFVAKGVDKELLDTHRKTVTQVFRRSPYHTVNLLNAILDLAQGFIVTDIFISSYRKVSLYSRCNISTLGNLFGAYKISLQLLDYNNQFLTYEVWPIFKGKDHWTSAFLRISTFISIKQRKKEYLDISDLLMVLLVYVSFTWGINTVCVAAGCPEVGLDPRASLTNLTRYMITSLPIPTSVQRTSSKYTAESDRALTSLRIRHFMEVLPGRRPFVDGQRLSAQAHWKMYWREQYEDSLMDPDHPLAFISNSGEDSLFPTGVELYNILSRSVHGYEGPFVIDPKDWRPEVVAVLRAVYALGTGAPQVLSKAILPPPTPSSVPVVRLPPVTTSSSPPLAGVSLASTTSEIPEPSTVQARSVDSPPPSAVFPCVSMKLPPQAALPSFRPPSPFANPQTLPRRGPKPRGHRARGRGRRSGA